MSMNKKNWTNPSIQVLAMSKTAAEIANVEFDTTTNNDLNIVMDPTTVNVVANVMESQQAPPS